MIFDLFLIVVGLVALYMLIGVAVAMWCASLSDDNVAPFTLACWILGWPMAFLWAFFKWK